MARMRTLKPSFFTDRHVTKLSFAGRLWFEGMWVFALCDAGHLDDDAYELRLKVFPADQVDEDALTDEVLATGMVVRKQMPDGRTYLKVVKLAVHSRSAADKRWTPRCQYCACEATAQRDDPQQTPDDLSKPHQSSVGVEETQRTPDPGGFGFGIGEVQNLPASADADAAADVLELDVERPPPKLSLSKAWLLFWDAYPVKRDKPKAHKAFERAYRRVDDPWEIIRGAERYRDDRNRDPTKTKYAEGWLNGDRWDDPDLPSPMVNGFPIQQATGTSPWDRR